MSESLAVGPAGLFFAYLMGRAGAGHDIRLFERDPEGATYGWGHSRSRRSSSLNGSFPVSFTVKWGDCDEAGVVHYPRFL